MTGFFACLSPLRAAPWSIAALLLLAGCQSSQIPPWLQDGTGPRPQATRPPSEAIRAPRAIPPERAPKGAPARARPPVTGPGLPPPPAVPVPQPGAASGTSGPAPDQGEVQAAPPEQKWPSFAPYLTRPPKGAKKAQPKPRAVPPPASADTVRVAMLLPLSGSNRKLAHAMLNAAQMALFHFADNRFELLVHDTRGTPDGAAEAASMAVGDGARLILGPLLSAPTRAVGDVARAANVPVVAFTSDRAVAGDGVYTMGFLPSAEVRRIVAYAGAKGIRRFAVLAPDNAYGGTVVDAMETAVAAVGGTVTRVQFYDPLAGDFTDVVRPLADFSRRRQALLDQRRALEGRDDEVAKSALKRLERLQTIGDVPFDALVVADGGKRLQSIAALLPYYDIDPAKVRMLGTGQWDEPGIGAEPALIGGWFAAPSPTTRADFVTAYRAVYGDAPPRLATLAYDAMALASVLAQGSNGPDFSAAAITVPSGFWGRDGIFRFLSEGVAERGLAVMRVKRHGAEVISRAPETFQARIN